ncbi:MAG: radical SAM protein [Thermoleophilia bacterium]|nr:radical SAM protein [Thermoleophilia bacterium]
MTTEARAASPLPLPALRGPAAAPPREAYFEVTNRCNLRCGTCPRTHMRVEAPADLSLARLVQIAAQMDVVERAVLHGVGEPLLNPDLPAMVAHLAGRGARVVVNTNGTLLDARRGDALAAAGLAELRVSVDAATRETFRRIRGADALPRILANLAAFAARGHRAPELSVWATALRENLDELPDLVRLAAEAGVRRVYLQRLVFNGVGLAVREQSVYRDLSAREEAVMAECRRVASGLGVALEGSGGAAEGAVGGGAGADDQAWRSCRRPWKVLYVTANGNVMPCCIAPFATTDFAGITLGNVERDGLARVWNGPAMRRFRARHQSDDPPTPCARCGSEWSL